MKDVLHGFAVIKKSEIRDIGATVYTMRHRGCGATLYFIQREEQNMTFAIGFQTPPYDDTGVFHILEHSVLCGSEKFPLKDPFVELLKGSVNTFLNAMTYPDMTVYPVSSQNKRDFLNLVDVYMDAVLHPLMRKKKEVFLQEGIRLCENEDGTLSYNGVVYNEMKGAYSSPDELLAQLMNRQLYQGSPYACDSGGDPECIPTLTYEQFLAAHDTYYHPSGAYIVLDGDIDLDEVLPLLDGYLSKYEKRERNVNISLPKPQFSPTLYHEYELPEDESLEGRMRYAMGFGGYSYDERERLATLGVLLSYLAGGNESPLKSALVGGGLCEDVAFSIPAATKESRIMLFFQNTSEEHLPDIRKSLYRVIEKELTVGLDRERLLAELSRMEFSLREADFGTYPRGIVYTLRVLEGVMYGAAAEELLSYEGMLSVLRENLDTGYYESILRELFIENGMYCDVVLTPSHTKAKEDERILGEKLKALRLGMKDEELFAIREDTNRLAAWQSTPDSPEALATVPTLSISDIDPLPKERVLSHYTLPEGAVHHFAKSTGGITYLQLTFNVSELTDEELSSLGLLTTLLGRVDTEEKGALALRTEIQTKLGSFSASVGAFSSGGVYDKATACVQITASVLDHKKESLPALLCEILTKSRFTSRDQIATLLKQHRLSLEEFVYEGGYTPALFYAEGQLSAEMSVYDNAEGYTAYLRMKKLDEELNTAWAALPDTLTTLARRVFTRERLSLGYISEALDEDFARSVLAAFEADGVTPPSSAARRSQGTAEQAIRIPGAVSHAVRAFHLGKDNTGHMQVAKNLLSYEYLWNEIRVASGAYGAGFGAQKNGLGFFYSFRDPDPENSDRVFLNAPCALVTLVKEGVAGEKHIIGAISAGEPYLTPRSEGLLAFAEYARGVTYEERKKRRKEILQTTPEDLIGCAEALKAHLSNSVPCTMRSAQSALTL